jgi:fructosamine-3-kinase
VSERTFVKTQRGMPPDFFVAEARGLELLRVVDGGPPVPRVIAVDRDRLVLQWIEPAAPTAAAAAQFGRALSVVHRCGGASFGADHNGYLATLALDNTRTEDWPEFYAERRVRPLLREAADRGALTSSETAEIGLLAERLPVVAGPPEPPARTHGDLWAGNLQWASDGQVWLIDAASVHDGHRETDLAMLELFGAPYLETILAAYDEAHPLAAGWRGRIALHQLFPLLVHAALFGGDYGARAAAAARRAMMAS